ncbi:MAG: hydrogenase maturation nickel metallochaperone HypA [Planctomycetota bacterium]|nr:hydrogenase maturation nickel metallochaperone HypA [Planctomycetota bacterium]
MHELSIATEICRCVERATESARKEGGAGSRVKCVSVRVGELSGVDPEALLFAWEAAVRDTPLEGARLEIERIRAKIRCRGCGAESGMDFPGAVCPACGSAEAEIAGGMEMDVISAQVEDEN